MKIKVTLIAIVAFIGIVIWGKVKIPNTKTELITINTTEWVEVITDGKDFGSEIIITNGIKLNYHVRINSLDNPTIELPSEKEVKLGPKENIEKVFYKLKRDQIYDIGQIPFKWK